ncbi:MAG: DegT/DnrJ/EryC1/StrS family aminotransferase, partial [Promethearchaeota archaeon]
CAVFSLQGSKILPAGEAGVLVTNDIEIHEKAVALGHYELINSLERDKYKKYAMTGLGVKHRISPLHAAIALCQLRKFPKVNERITKNCEKFRNAVKDIEGTGFEIPEIPKDVTRTYFMNQILYKEGEGIIPKQEIIFMLQSEGLKVGVSRYQMLHGQPYFLERGYSKDDLKFTDDLAGQLISFPNFPWDETGELVDQYVQGIEKVAHHLKSEF